MLDLIMLVLVILCFALALVYAGFCDRLLAFRADNDVSS